MVMSKKNIVLKLIYRIVFKINSLIIIIMGRNKIKIQKIDNERLRQVKNLNPGHVL
jgi:hypothetical protein